MSGPQYAVPDFFRRHSSYVFAFAALLFFLTCIWLLPVDDTVAGKEWVSEATRQFGFVNSGDQLRAHFLTVVAVALLSALSFYLGKQNLITSGPIRDVPRVASWACALLVGIGLAAYGKLLPLPLARYAAAIATVFFLFAFAIPRLRIAGIERVALALISAYLAVLIVPGLLASPITLMESDPVALVQFENHLLHLPSRGGAVAAGQNFFAELPMGYGLLMPSIMSVAEVWGHGKSLASQLRFVQICQVLFCLAAAGAYLLYRPRHYVGVLAALLIAGPYWTSAGLGIWHANQTGFRALGLPIGVLGLLLAGRLAPGTGAWCLGVLAAVAALVNMEMAVAVTAGFVVLLVVRARAIPVALFLRMAAAGLITFVLYLVVYSLALGRFPFSTQAVELLASIARVSGGGFGSRLFSAGYERESFYIVPVALLMFGHAMYVVIDAFRKLGSRALPRRTAVRAGIASMLIIWFSYYFAFPNWWQIWPMFFLYGFLVIDALDLRRFGAGARALGPLAGPRFARMRVAPALLVLLFFTALLIPHTNRHLFIFGKMFLNPKWVSAGSEVAMFSGLLFPKDKGELLERKAAKLKELHAAAKGRLVYLTFNTAIMPRLSGIYQVAPYRDMFSETRGDLAFDGIMAGLLKQRPDIVLIDAPTGALALTGPRKEFQERMRAGIAPGFRLAGTEDGWQIWRPRDTN